jgi:hypothetical protein
MIENKEIKIGEVKKVSNTRFFVKIQLILDVKGTTVYYATSDLDQYNGYYTADEAGNLYRRNDIKNAL